MASMGQDKARLSGRVLDKKGNPVPKVQVSLIYEPCDTCIDQVIPAVSTNEDGVFFFLQDYGLERATVFVEGVVPKDSWNPINASNLAFSKHGRFSGTPVNFLQSNSIHLGDILPAVFYEKTAINLRELFAIDLQQHDYSMKGLTLEIKDDRGNLVVEKSIPQEFVDKEFSLSLVLPQGRWYLFFSVCLQNRMIKKRVLVNAGAIVFNQKGNGKSSI